MTLSHKLNKLAKDLISSTREGIWGLGWQVAKLLEQDLPIHLKKYPLTRHPAFRSTKQVFTNVERWKDQPIFERIDEPIEVRIVEQVSNPREENETYSLAIQIRVKINAINAAIEKLTTIFYKLNHFAQEHDLKVTNYDQITPSGIHQYRNLVHEENMALLSFYAEKIIPQGSVKSLEPEDYAKFKD